ncbi:hypothetical protein [Sphingobium chlorophenolicum]|uniref:Prepilin type IV endopeptidase peptidase domain-containing protein n=1 Tax=Sphingobium chlorophenolicum TaxID=46429 RepID=A0A081R7X3_SPHCR|nr:hypothetical protein [Sphingobium chlorophenolicum]KEQ51296.1 hypothetical protein BV95_04440 [Sphingobium chlorophenolicum]
MNGASFIGCALMILLLLPVLVLHWEGRVVTDRLYGAIALGGVGFAALFHGAVGAMLAVGVGLACLLLLSSAVAAISLFWRLRLLTGGHIKLIAAGATWLSAGGALLMLALAVGLFVVVAVILRVRKVADPRPDMAGIAAIALLSAQLMT